MEEMKIIRNPSICKQEWPKGTTVLLTDPTHVPEKETKKSWSIMLDGTATYLAKSICKMNEQGHIMIPGWLLSRFARNHDYSNSLSIAKQHNRVAKALYKDLPENDMQGPNVKVELLEQIYQLLVILTAPPSWDGKSHANCHYGIEVPCGDPVAVVYYCRRYPPSQNGGLLYPLVGRDVAPCGEWKSKEAKGEGNGK